MDILELFTPESIAANWTEVYSNQIPYIGTALFPAQKKAGLDLKWIKGSKGLPVSLMPSAFDAKATFRDRIGLQKLETEMPFFREGFKIKERDRQEILRIQESNDPYLTEVLARLYDDANELISGADVVAERMRMSLLFPVNGEVGISIKANGVDYTYEYDAADAWKATNYTALTGNSAWDQSATADPFADIDTVKNAILNATGTELVTVLLNSVTFNYLMKANAVKNRFLSVAGITTGYVTRGDVKRVFEDTNNVQFVIYDKQYKDESGVAHKFVPDNYICLLPSGAVGSTWYGTTPEEADLKEKCQLVNTGVAITQIKDEHPVNINTFASEIVLPSYERMDEVAVIKVK